MFGSFNFLSRFSSQWNFMKGLCWTGSKSWWRCSNTAEIHSLVRGSMYFVLYFSWVAKNSLKKRTFSTILQYTTDSQTYVPWIGQIQILTYYARIRIMSDCIQPHISMPSRVSWKKSREGPRGTRDLIFGLWPSFFTSRHNRSLWVLRANEKVTVMDTSTLDNVLQHAESKIQSRRQKEFIPLNVRGKKSRSKTADIWSFLEKINCQGHTPFFLYQRKREEKCINFSVEDIFGF